MGVRQSDLAHFIAVHLSEQLSAEDVGRIVTQLRRLTRPTNAGRKIRQLRTNLPHAAWEQVIFAVAEAGSVRMIRTLAWHTTDVEELSELAQAVSSRARRDHRLRTLRDDLRSRVKSAEQESMSAAAREHETAWRRALRAPARQVA